VKHYRSPAVSDKCRWYVKWLVFLIAAVVFGFATREALVSPVAAPEAPIGYFCGDYPKIVTTGLWASGRASWYGEDFRGRRTASGTRFNPDEMTCAHRSLKFGTRLEVRYHGRAVVVTCSDRGPYVAGRVLDLSEAAFARLAPVGAGVINVQWRKL